MKITQLKTLSQFIDYVCELYPPDEPETGEDFQYAIYSYNLFLKRKLTKDMLVGDSAIFDIPPKYFHLWSDKININGRTFYEGISLSGLAYFFEGQLKLKNVEI